MVVDKTELKKLIDNADTYLEEDYLPAGWPEFQEALKEAKAVYDNDKATNKEVKNAIDTLLGAMVKLQYRQDKTQLNKVIEYASSLVLSNYTESSASAVDAALQNAIKVQQDNAAMQPAIRTATGELLDALLNLRLKADKTLLQSVLAQTEIGRAHV